MDDLRHVAPHLPFTYGFMDYTELEAKFVYEEVEFTDNFGPIEQGDRFGSVVWMLHENRLLTYDDDGDNKIVHDIILSITPTLSEVKTVKAKSPSFASSPYPQDQ